MCNVRRTGSYPFESREKEKTYVHRKTSVVRICPNFNVRPLRRSVYRTDITCRTAVKIGLATVPSKLPYGLPYGSSSVPTDQHSASPQTLVPSAGNNNNNGQEPSIVELVMTIVVPKPKLINSNLVTPPFIRLLIFFLRFA